jgi:uncharacterized protein YqhQ
MSESSPSAASPAKPYIGGQAVIEGVMMRSPHSLAIAVRRADGSISIRERPFTAGSTGWAKLPLLRGVATLVESLRLGSESLRFSAEMYERDLEAAEASAAGAKPSSKGSSAISSTLTALGVTLTQLVTRADAEPAEEEGGRAASPMAFMTIIMVAFMIALPQLLAWGASSMFHLNLDVRSPKFQLLTGAFKLIVVVGYLLGIRSVPEIRRVFQYHGAEHKTISTYEAREELVVANAKAKTTLHPRCGTTFLVMTVLVSIVVWTALGPLLPRWGGSKVAEQLVFFLMKLPFLPVLAATTFELQRFTARYCLTGPLRVLLYPGFLIQKITTIEPDEQQLEIALASLRATLWREEVGVQKALPASDAEVIGFPSYAALIDAPGLRDQAA